MCRLHLIIVMYVFTIQINVYICNTCRRQPHSFHPVYSANVFTLYMRQMSIHTGCLVLFHTLYSAFYHPMWMRHLQNNIPLNADGSYRFLTNNIDCIVSKLKILKIHFQNTFLLWKAPIKKSAPGPKRPSYTTN